MVQFNLEVASISNEDFFKSIVLLSCSVLQVDPSVVASQAVTTSKWDLLENGKDDEISMEKIEPEEDIDGAPIEEDRNGSEDGECPDEDEDNKFVCGTFH